MIWLTFKQIVKKNPLKFGPRSQSTISRKHLNRSDYFFVIYDIYSGECILKLFSSKMVPNFWWPTWSQLKSNKNNFLDLIFEQKSTSSWFVSLNLHHWGHANRLFVLNNIGKPNKLTSTYMMIWFKTCNFSLKSTLCQLICTPLCIYGLLWRLREIETARSFHSILKL